MADTTDTETDWMNVPLNRLVTYRLLRVNARLNAQATRILKKTADISPAKWRVMVMIDTLGPVTAAEIVRRMEVDKGQLSRTIKSMVAEGMIRVTNSESDHRSQLIEMTGKGWELYGKARPHMRARQAHLVGSLGVEDRDALFRALEKLEAAATDWEVQT